MHISDRMLQAFITLADVRKFTVAAERCHMSQSALSQLIARLEEHYSVRLFDRGRRSVTLTEEGERLLVSARRVLNELQGMERDLRAVTTLEVGQVCLAVVPSLAAYWLPEALRPFREQYPRIHLQLFDVSSPQCSVMVREGQADFSLCSEQGLHHEVDSQLLFDEPMHLASPTGNAPTCDTDIRLADLAGMTFIRLHDMQQMQLRTRHGLTPMMQLLEQANIVDAGLEVKQLSTQAGLVAAGFGSCLAPACSLPQFDRPGIATRRFDPGEVARPIYVSSRRGHSLSPAAAALLAAIRAHVQATLAPLPDNPPGST